jgi:hypothetical protein
VELAAGTGVVWAGAATIEVKMSAAKADARARLEERGTGVLGQG